jgi:hypothetical protein
MERRKFSREFKLEAVNLVRDRGVSIVQEWLASGDVMAVMSPLLLRAQVWSMSVVALRIKLVRTRRVSV